jgi:hypothetical protein
MDVAQAYSTATTPYGPYTYRGESSSHSASHDRNFGDTGQGHGRWWTWNNQWFHVWCEFVDQHNNETEVTVAELGHAQPDAIGATRRRSKGSRSGIGLADGPLTATNQQGVALSLQPCRTGARGGSGGGGRRARGGILNGSRWRAKPIPPGSSGTVFVSMDMVGSGGEQLCIDISHPKSPPLGEVYAFPCNYMANEQWVMRSSGTGALAALEKEPRGAGQRLQSVEFGALCLGTAPSHNNGVLVGPCDDAPSWIQSANGQLVLVDGTAARRIRQLTPLDDAKKEEQPLCLTVTGHIGPSPPGPHPPNRKDYHRWRDTWMTYAHYRANGDIVDDWNFLNLHGATGVGQYDASANSAHLSTCGLQRTPTPLATSLLHLAASRWFASVALAKRSSQTH